MKRWIFYVTVIILLTGCTATYNLKISQKGFQENLTINATSLEDNSLFTDYQITAYYDVQVNNEDPTKKIENVAYYNRTLNEDKKGFNIINYNYLFGKDDFQRSNIIASSIDTFILKQYDHDEDGTNDYMLLSTSDNFNFFEYNDSLEQVTINITCYYEVISSNADEVNKNVHTWYLNKEDIKAINMVYNPDKVIDDRSLWEKIIQGDYLNIFTLSLAISLIGFLAYKFFKKYSQKRDEI